MANEKINVTNNHDALLNIAGVDIRPGATAAVDAKTLEGWKTGHAAKIWLEQELVVVGDRSGSKVREPKKPAEPEGSAGSDGKPAKVDRAAYIARAKELELDLKSNVSNADLVAAVNEAEAKKAQEQTSGDDDANA